MRDGDRVAAVAENVPGLLELHFAAAGSGAVIVPVNFTAEEISRRPRAAFTDGWFHSGDLAVMHPDGYVELRDRAKDIIVSGGENISTIEIEATLTAHPAVEEAAVIGVPDERWGELPARS